MITKKSLAVQITNRVLRDIRILTAQTAMGVDDMEHAIPQKFRCTLTHGDLRRQVRQATKPLVARVQAGGFPRYRFVPGCDPSLLTDMDLFLFQVPDAEFRMLALQFVTPTGA